MLSTDKQIKYLCALADKVEKIKAIIQMVTEQLRLH